MDKLLFCNCGKERAWDEEFCQSCQENIDAEKIIKTYPETISPNSSLVEKPQRSAPAVKGSSPAAIIQMAVMGGGGSKQVRKVIGIARKMGRE